MCTILLYYMSTQSQVTCTWLNKNLCEIYEQTIAINMCMKTHKQNLCVFYEQTIIASNMCMKTHKQNQLQKHIIWAHNSK